MKLILSDQRTQLLANHRYHENAEILNRKPVVKLFSPYGSQTWLLASIYPDAPTIAFGIGDLGFGFPETGDIDLDELAAARCGPAPAVERDRHFKPKLTLLQYLAKATAAGYLVA